VIGHRNGVDPSIVDLNDLIDGQEVQRSSILFLVIAALILVADGFDLGVIGYVGPELVKEWQMAPAQLTSVFSAGLVGLLFGAPLLGYVGDRFGRKRR
jgi:AAHS family 4-hydroxybenzoate transporter-like MFS transporter